MVCFARLQKLAKLYFNPSFSSSLSARSFSHNSSRIVCIGDSIGKYDIIVLYHCLAAVRVLLNAVKPAGSIFTCEVCSTFVLKQRCAVKLCCQSHLLLA